MMGAICGGLAQNGIGSTPRDPLVIGASKNLEMQISELHEQVVVLLGRLSAVSRIPVPCAQEQSPGPIKNSTPLSDTLDCYAERVYSMKCDVRDAIDRLEI